MTLKMIIGFSTYFSKIQESLLDDDVYFDPENDKRLIEEWIKSNYDIDGRLSISNDVTGNYIVSCVGRVVVKTESITSLTNGLFQRVKINGDFYCGRCSNLTSLEGAPEKVGGSILRAIDVII